MLFRSTREQMQKLILHIWQERQFTFVLVTHSIEEAVFLGEKIVILSEGPGKILEIVENKNLAENEFRDTSKFYNQCTLIRRLIEGQRL